MQYIIILGGVKSNMQLKYESNPEKKGYEPEEIKANITEINKKLNLIIFSYKMQVYGIDKGLILLKEKLYVNIITSIAVLLFEFIVLLFSIIPPIISLFIIIPFTIYFINSLISRIYEYNVNIENPYFINYKIKNGIFTLQDEKRFCNEKINDLNIFLNKLNNNQSEELITAGQRFEYIEKRADNIILNYFRH